MNPNPKNNPTGPKDTNPFDWIGRNDIKMILAALITVLAALAFLKLADVVTKGQHDNLDKRILLALRTPDNLAKPIGPTALAPLVRDISALGGAGVLAIVTAATLGFLALKKDDYTFALVLFATLGAIALNLFLKAYFDRPRPIVVPHLDYVRTQAFPSGHAMLSAVVYLTLGVILGSAAKKRRLKAYLLIVAFSLAALVGLSRIYLGVHYPTDVLAGWAIGLAWATLCWLVARALQTRRQKNASSTPSA